MSPNSDPDQSLRDALEASQRSGFLGDRPIDEVIEHARAFVRALDGFGSRDLGERPSVLDLGSGGGVPGLVIAYDRPDVAVTLIDRRSKRTDFLARVVSRFGWSDRVTVVCTDVDTYTPLRLFDAVVARSFGPPERTLTVAVGLVTIGGRLVISEPPEADRWPTDLLEQLSVERLSAPRASMAVFRRH